MLDRDDHPALSVLMYFCLSRCAGHPACTISLSGFGPAWCNDAAFGLEGKGREGKRGLLCGPVSRRMRAIVRVVGRSLMTAFAVFTHVDSRALLSHL